MANAARADEQSSQQVEAPEKESPLLDLSTPVPTIVQARAEPAERTDDPVRMYLRDMGSPRTAYWALGR